MQVPDDFDMSILRPVNYENKASFTRTFGDAFLERWLVLRLAVSPTLFCKRIAPKFIQFSFFLSLFEY